MNFPKTGEGTAAAHFFQQFAAGCNYNTSCIEVKAQPWGADLIVFGMEAGAAAGALETLGAALATETPICIMESSAPVFAALATTATKAAAMGLQLTAFLAPLANDMLPSLFAQV